jgi:hypothetical protein
LLDPWAAAVLRIRLDPSHRCVTLRRSQPLFRGDQRTDVAMSHSSHAYHSQASIFSEYPVLTGILVGIGSLLPHFFLPANLSVSFAAIVISLIAGIYFGFAVMNGSTREQMIEFSVAGLFMLAAISGIAIWPGIVALAYFAHAGWDFLHHNRLNLWLVRIPSWYVPWCVIIDVIVGAGLIVFWRAHGII